MIKLDSKKGYYTTICGTYEIYYSRFSILNDVSWTASPRKNTSSYKTHYTNTLQEMKSLLEEKYPELFTEAWVSLHS